MSTKSIENMYPLSPLQQGMLFHSLYAPESGVYCTQFVCTIDISDLQAFERAWQQVVDRHPILRTAFAWQNLKQPIQVVGSSVKLPMEHLDWRELSEHEQVARLEEYLKAERGRGFALTTAPLMRLVFIRVAEHTYRFIWNHHHLLLDGWSMALLVREVFTFYEAFRQGQTLQLPQPRPYRDYIEWIQQQDSSRTEAFWREKLHGFEAPTPLGIDQAPGSLLSQKDVYNTEQLRLTESFSTTLRTFARQHGLTLNTLAQGAWALLLSRYSGRDEVVFGVTVSGRSAKLAGIESMIGLFINCLPLRLRVPPQASLNSWLKDVQEQQVQLMQFEFSTLADIQRWSSVPAGFPLFESFLVFENYPVDSSVDRQARSLGLHDLRDVAYTNVPLHIRVLPGVSILLQATYDSRRFHPAAITRLLGQFQGLLESMVAEPSKALCALLPTPRSERKRHSAYRNLVRPANPYEKYTQEEVEQSIAARFESRVAKYGDKPAVKTKTRELTYDELNRLANLCAHKLLALPASIERVGLLFQHDALMVAAILGALKAGKTYVPVDPLHPVERNSLIIRDAQIGAILTSPSSLGHAEELASVDHSVIGFDDRAAEGSKSNPGITVSPDAPAYILYTSGSTGRPKGVVQNNRNVLHHIRCYVNGLHICADDRLTLFSSYGFDAAVMDIFGAILTGATLYPYNLREDGINRLAEWLIQNEITIYHSTPTVYRYFMRSLAGNEEFPDLRMMVLGGEESHRADFELYKRRFSPQCLFVNGSGPTESTMSLQFFLDKQTELSRLSVPLGYPVEDTEILLLDDDGQPATLYGPGEIAIRSPYIALGYWQQPELTKAAFLPDPEGSGNKIYRTGDMGQVLHDGNIEYLGRKDCQVKIRGFRVELGEIEAFLNSHTAVLESAVAAFDSARGEKYLVAYLVARDGNKPSHDALRQFLKECVPDHMAPTSFVWLDKLPLTAGGKIDRLSLPPPQISQDESFIEPRTPLEQKLADIWAQVLGLERVGVYDNFFDLGGHSLLAMQITSRIRQEVKVQMPLSALFENENVAELAAAIAARQAVQEESATTGASVISKRSRSIQEQLAELTRAVPEESP